MISQNLTISQLSALKNGDTRMYRTQSAVFQQTADNVTNGNQPDCYFVNTFLSQPCPAAHMPGQKNYGQFSGDLYK